MSAYSPVLSPLLAAALSGYALTALAQDELALEEIVVSASRSEARAFDTPAAISQIRASEIQAAGFGVNISEPLSHVPGIVALDRQNYAQDLQLSIRGFGARSAFGIRGIRILVDGIPATMPDGQGQVSAIDLAGAERIEVLRGPLAQLYGNAAGGVLQVHTGVGGADRLSTSIDIGSDHTHRYGLRLRGEQGRMQGAASFMHFDTDGWRDHSAARRRLFNSKLRFDFSPAAQLTLIGTAFDQPLAEDPQGLTRDEFRRRPRSAAPLALSQDARKSVRQEQAGVLLELRPAAGHTVTGRFYYGQRDLFQALAIPLAAQQSPTSGGGIIELDREYGGLGLQYRVRDFLHPTLTLSVGTEADGMREHRRGFVNDGGQRTALKRDEDNEVWNRDFYAQLAWQPTPRWTLQAGVRHSTVRFRVDDRYITGDNPDDSGSVRYRATSPVIGLTWHAHPALNLYLNYGRGFETPSFTELAYRSTGSGLNLALDPARSHHAEAGLKFRPDGEQQLELALFRITTEDELVVDSNIGGRTVYRNAGRTERHGMELLYHARLLRSLEARLSWSEFDARFDSRDETDDNRLPGAPDRQLYAGLTWRPLHTSLPAGLSVTLEALHVGRIQVDDLNSDAASSHTRFNARLALEREFGRLRLLSYLRVNNLTDKHYAGSVIVNQSAGRYFEPAPGRNWAVGLMAELSL